MLVNAGAETQAMDLNLETAIDVAGSAAAHVKLAAATTRVEHDNGEGFACCQSRCGTQRPPSKFWAMGLRGICRYHQQQRTVEGNLRHRWLASTT